MKKIIVLGSNSFAGSCYVDYLLNKNYKIYGFSRSNEPSKLLLKYKFNMIVTVAAHTKKTLVKAFVAGIDAALLSPIFPTKSHLDRDLLGLTKLIKWNHEIKLPIYALGGINLETVPYLRNSGIVGLR